MPELGLPDVAGYCPMGCGMTLVLAGQERAGEGNITCAAPGCPRPDAVHVILQDPETEHLVVLDGRGFSVQHPLRERLDGELHRCELHTWLREHDEAPEEPGRYRATRHQPDTYSEDLGAPEWDLEPLEGSRG